ncbi:hypothetical protein JHL17_08650 [Azospirillum sp. YIM B02556]|uniref:Uncharacterized protein n=1 Tax=Azospirillum endophyticum TaxID=2800326 RepID=A0ABS1F258_9PROT|nr:hypothetical protein [Azospirillum endophyticum]MBK1837480.1 hypothetical protein [Azospirillum endophyticum]
MIREFLPRLLQKILSWMRTQHIDRKKFSGYFITILGFVIFLFGPSDHTDTVADALRSSFSIVASTVLMMCGFCGIIHQSLTKRTLYWLDFFWMLGTTLGVIVALAQALLLPADDLRSTINGQMESGKAKIMAMLEDQFYVKCRINQKYSKEICDNIAQIHEYMRRENANPPKYLIERICPRPIQLPHPLDTICIPLNHTIGAMEIEVMKDQSNAKTLRYLISLLPMIISILLGLRMAKSASELWWMP